MNLYTQVLHIVGSGAVAYFLAHSIRDPQSRPNTLAGFHLAEAGSVPFLTALSERATTEGDTWLAEKLTRHAADERRHGQIFAQALKQLNKQVIDFKKSQTVAAKPAERQRSPFFDAYFDGYSLAQILNPQQADWTVFMASTYILELDASKDFARMAKALSDNSLQSANLKKGLLSIAQDETGHAAYLYEALERRLPSVAVIKLVDQWRTRKVNAMLAMVTNLVQKGGQTPTLVQDGVPMEMSTSLTESDVARQVAA
ncbi:MAG TPA: hypothetical protein V6D03_00140 [Candidatus Caenarcaniphilales bacterium]